MSRFLEIIKVSRPGFWPTHIWFYVLPFAQKEMLTSIPFWLGGIYICFPLGLLLYGWNDLGDVETDAINDRKGNWLFGAKPDATTRQMLPFAMVAIQIPFMIAFVYFGSWKMIVWLAAVCLVNFTYNNLGFKRRPVLDLLNQTGYLLIFVLGSWLCAVEQLNTPAMIFSALFAMQSHLFGQVMDVDEDAAAGRKTTAVMIGVFRSKLLVAAIMFTEALIAYRFFSGKMVAVFMSTGGLFFLLDAFFGPKKYPLPFLYVFFVIWNLIAVLTVHFIWRDGIFMLSER